jgi:hypothetical protein
VKRKNADPRIEPPKGGSVISSTDKTETVFVPFHYSATVLKGRKRKPEVCTYRGIGAAEIASVGLRDTQLAYGIKHWHGSFGTDVLQYGGRLWWPLKIPGKDGGSPHQVWQDVLAGQFPIFGGESDEAGVPPKLEDDITVRRVVSSEYDGFVLGIQSKIADCLLVDGGLFVVGGPPVAVLHGPHFQPGMIEAINPGADRCGNPEDCGLSFKAGNFSETWVDMAICQGTFSLAGVEDLLGRLKPPAEGTLWLSQIEVFIPHELDAFDLRVDGAFRFARYFASRMYSPEALNWRRGFNAFAFLAMSSDVPDLTAARLRALHVFLQAAEEDEQEYLFWEDMRGIREILASAKPRKRRPVSKPANRLTKDEDEAVATFSVD